ncbi:M23 family metallopeptidase [Variovorax sp. LjRoot290]|uniref:murein hydrolase activator EnvC family protein n=1 Tax=Variovorax sp. LjRoot290 TaxID=3342316 RepID=UPI003ECCA0F8
MSNENPLPAARRPTVPASLASGIAVGALFIMVGCATQPGPTGPALSSVVGAKSPSPDATARVAQSSSVSKTRSAIRSAKKATRTKPRGAERADTAAQKPQNSLSGDAPVGSSERRFLRPAAGAVLTRFDGRASKGVDFAGAKGDPVYAARAGQVAFAAQGPRGYGQLVMIKHDGAYMTAYAHNSQLLVKEGQNVQRGQVIARMGSTDADRVKLHFEVRRGGAAVDPIRYIEAGSSPVLLDGDARH